MADYYQQQFEQKTEELKKTFQEHSARLEDKIEAKNSQISERAIEKTLKIVSLIGGSLVAFIFLFGIFGYGDIKESVTQTFTRKVENWLQIDDNESPLKESILTFRDRTLLDSLYVRLLRSKLGKSQQLEVSNDELEVLIELANNKALSLADYRLILEVYQKVYTPFGFRFPGDYKSNLFDKVMSESGFNRQVEKQKVFFETFKNDRNILKYVNGILDNADHHLINSAFDVLTEISPNRARQYIEKNFDHVNDEEMKFSMSKFMVDNWIYIEKIENYSNSLLSNSNADGFLTGNYFSLLLSMIEVPNSQVLMFETTLKEPNQEKVKLSSTMLEKAVNLGFSVKLSDDMFNERKMVIGFPRNGELSLDKSDFDKLYTSRWTIDKIFDDNLSNIESLTKLISFYEIKDKENYILSVSAKLNTNAKIKLENGKTLKHTDLIGNLWLTVDKNEKLIALYRDRTSEIITSHVKEISNFNGSDFSFVYNKPEINSLLYKNNDLYWLL
ncbi:hypothetical protein [Vibrio parahaemolyticus]|uniref:hypothetical protein n=1 Tax=Vibrio parahaemolyticus TaxID=670 RepID=UPI0006B2A878|nr:hypothetical protein [Vibrio parahaemolyticus]KOY39694.1 hypothetical protein ACX08_00870 [Vibrio parahaemolyticus]MCR9873564.1 hypothetical protein [Vibrio parahaemolyticus]ODY13038.1 hypothetical protein BBM17_17035 [Vibrio parahaemolyticus]